MEIIRTVADMKARAAAWKAEGLSIGLVPTMGSLHEGHESLMDAARAASDRVVVSVFVNPIQFGPGEDYEAYPRDLERDARICERHGVDVVFMPGFQGWWKYLKDYRELCWGFFDWGTSALDEQLGWRRQALRETDRYGKVFVALIRFVLKLPK